VFSCSAKNGDCFKFCSWTSVKIAHLHISCIATPQQCTWTFVTYYNDTEGYEGEVYYDEDAGDDGNEEACDGTVEKEGTLSTGPRLLSAREGPRSHSPRERTRFGVGKSREEKMVVGEALQHSVDGRRNSSEPTLGQHACKDGRIAVSEDAWSLEGEGGMPWSAGSVGRGENDAWHAHGDTKVSHSSLTKVKSGKREKSTMTKVGSEVIGDDSLVIGEASDSQAQGDTQAHSLPEQTEEKAAAAPKPQARVRRKRPPRVRGRPGQLLSLPEGLRVVKDTQ
jgi:hypothetical protein